MSTQPWVGIYPAICTPFTAEGAVDLDAQRRVVRFALDGGVDGIVAFGLAGEVLRLTDDERRVLAETIVDEVGGAVPVLVGAGTSSVRGSVELARHAESAGVDGVVLASPVGVSVSPDALVDYFVRVAVSVSVPVMIQDAPAYLGVGLGAEAVGRIGAAAGNVRHVKLEAGPIEIREWIERLGDDYAVWGGDGGVYLLDSMRAGAAGIIPGVDLVDRLVAVYAAELEGDAARADALFRELMPTLVYEMHLSIDHYNTCAKHTLARRGVLEVTSLRQPASSFDGFSSELLDRYLDGLGLPVGGARVG